MDPDHLKTSIPPEVPSLSYAVTVPDEVDPIRQRNDLYIVRYLLHERVKANVGQYKLHR